MKNFVLEVCVDSVESAIAAYRGKATRLELCSDLVVGGMTPSVELFRMVKEETNLPVHVLIRPRFGDFLYTEFEYELMCRQIHTYVKEGADAFVIGSLNEDGTLNEEQMNGMISCAGGRKITLHRAFDMARDSFEALEAAKGLGVNTILTSGGAKNCYEGRDVISELLKRAGDTEILIGGGVDAENVRLLTQEMPARSFHMSGKEIIQSRMRYRNKAVSMGLPGISEYEIWRTDEKRIRSVSEVLEGLKTK